MCKPDGARDIRIFFGLIQVRKQYEEAERLLRQIGFTSKVFTPDSVVATLSGGERQGVAIARVMYFDADLIHIIYHAYDVADRFVILDCIVDV